MGTPAAPGALSPACGAVLAAADKASASPPSSTCTTSTGFEGFAAAADRSASARAASPGDVSPSAGIAVTTTASHESSASARDRAPEKSRAEAPVVRSSGGSGRNPSERHAS